MQRIHLKQKYGDLYLFLKGQGMLGEPVCRHCILSVQGEVLWALGELCVGLTCLLALKNVSTELPYYSFHKLCLLGLTTRFQVWSPAIPPAPSRFFSCKRMGGHQTCADLVQLCIDGQSVRGPRRLSWPGPTTEQWRWVTAHLSQGPPDGTTLNQLSLSRRVE